MIENKGDIVIYKTQDGLTKINVKFTRNQITHIDKQE
mgnify:FL=1